MNYLLQAELNSLDGSQMEREIQKPTQTELHAL